jgi:hypothetical protein
VRLAGCGRNGEVTLASVLGCSALCLQTAVSYVVIPSVVVVVVRLPGIVKAVGLRLSLLSCRGGKPVRRMGLMSVAWCWVSRAPVRVLGRAGVVGALHPRPSVCCIVLCQASLRETGFGP